MIHVFADHDPGQQAHRRHATINDRRGNGGGRHGFTLSASILGANVTMDEEPGRFDIQLLSHIFADFD
jgi:hypothetical protein